MKILKITLILLVFLLISAWSYVAIQPSQYDVQRSRTISAPVSLLFSTVNDYKKWEHWSPWKAKDPSLEFEYPEKTSGVGGSYSWTGKDGKGTMKTLATVVNDSILQEIQFEQFPPSEVYWKFEYQSPKTTQVTWGMKSDNMSFLLKFFALISGGMDKMVGPDYEQGLENLDQYLQEQMAVYEIKEDGVKDYGGGFYLYITSNATQKTISTTMAKNFGIIYNYMAAHSIIPKGSPMSFYQQYNDDNGAMVVSCAVPVSENYDIKDASGILCGYTPRTKAYKTTLFGDYTHLGEAWTKSYKNVFSNNFTPSNLKPFEIYITDPNQTPNPAEWITELYIPLNK